MSVSGRSGPQSSIDGFLDNSFYVSQPVRGHHRAGLDAVLLAATLDAGAGGRVADFGAGSGVAGMAVAQRCPGVTVDLIDVEPDCLAHARSSLELPQNAHIAKRLKIIEADLTASGKEREQAGLRENHYHHIIANPPYNDSSLQASPDNRRAFAHVLEPGMLKRWIKTAAFVACPKAQLTLVMRPANLSDIMNDLGGRFGSVRLKPVHTSAQGAATLMLVRAVKGGRAATELMPPVMLHDDAGNSTHQAEEILRGRAGIFL